MGSVELAEATEVLDAGQLTTRELAAKANREHELVLAAAEGMLLHATAAGEALNQVRAVLSRADWTVWVENEFDGSRSSASIYMRVARYQERISPDMSLSQAYAVVKGLPPVSAREPRVIDSADIAEAKKLRAEGQSYAAIGTALGVHHATIRRYIDPAARKVEQEAKKRQKAALRVLQEHERKRAIKLAVRKKGGALAEAYTMISRLDEVLGQARREAESKDSRLAINEAHALRDKMMEQIVRALGVS